MRLRLYLLIFLCISTWSCEGFLTGDMLDNNPNKVDSVDQISPEALFAGSQVTMYGFMEGYLNRLVSMFMQQVAGQLYSHSDDYKCGPVDWRVDSRWSDLYGTGGLVDIRTIQEKAREQEKYVLLGIAQIWEAFLFSTAADLWGKVPYSQAVDSRYPEPKFDSQREIHETAVDLIEKGISNIEKDQEFKNLNDFTFSGDRSKWISAARTLQARIRLNWAEVDGLVAYQEALEYANQGISDVSGASDWKPLHRSGSNNEESMWAQFFEENLYVMGAGKLLVDLLKKDNDTRLHIYFDSLSAFNDSVVGISPLSAVPPYASQLNTNAVGSEDWGVGWISWHENQFIIAECKLAMGLDSEALMALNNTLYEIEKRWQSYDPVCSLPRYSEISGEKLLEAIMNEKYKALFLNMQTISDWRRTGYPKFVDISGNSTECEGGTPRRILYPELEKKTNSNTPKGDSIYDRVENDPS